MYLGMDFNLIKSSISYGLVKVNSISRINLITDNIWSLGDIVFLNRTPSTHKHSLGILCIHSR